MMKRGNKVSKEVKNTVKWKKKKRSILPYVLGGIVLTVGLAYLGFSLYFTNHFYINTTLNGVDVSGFSADKVKLTWEDDISRYALHVIERDGTDDEIKGQDIDLKLHWDDTVHGLIEKQNPLTWIKGVFVNDNLECGTIVNYDEKKLDKAIDVLHCMQEDMQVAPVNATVSEYDKNDGFTVVKEVMGTKIDRDVLKEGVMSAIEGVLDEYSIEETGGYVQPTITSDNKKLNKAVKKLNKYAKSAINYTVGNDNFVLDVNTFGDWFYLGKNQSVKINEEKVSEYVTSLASKYNTCYASKRLKTSYNNRMVTISNSHYGWKIDFETEKNQIINQITSGEKITRDLNYSMTANSHGANDYGDSYVEINLTAQHLFLYRNGLLVMETDFVSGNTSKDCGTPAGAFGITYTEKDAVLRGDDYETPVEYWMPFNGNIGMHDATWRQKFGGTIYKTGGSHGCVNLPKDAAQQIFSVVSTNYPVLVYELSGTEQSNK